MGYTNFVNGNKPNLSAPNLNNMQIELMKLVFPIGSTYITQEETNPSTILNFGTWERVKGKVLVGLDEDDTAFNIIGKTGGEKTHLLIADEMPLHKHGENITSSFGYEYPLVSENSEGATKDGYAFATSAVSEKNNKQVLTDSNGGGNPHNNLQPYQVVGYMWIRTA